LLRSGPATRVPQMMVPVTVASLGR